MRHELANQCLSHPEVWHICYMRYDYAATLQWAYGLRNVCTSFAKIKWRENSTLWLLNLFDKHQPTPLHNTVISICLNLIEAQFQIQLMDNIGEPKCKIG